ncbi:TPA: hypothetical protein ACJUE4_002837 [Listeria monocytogenes]
MKRFGNLGTRKKALIIGGSVIVLSSVGLFGFKQYDTNQRVEAAQELSTKNIDFKVIQKGIDSYVIEDGYLSKNVSSDQLEKNTNQLKKLKEFSKADYIDDNERKVFLKKVSDANQQVDLIANKLDTQKQLNALFEGEVIIENEVKTDGIVKEDVQSVELDLKGFKTEDDWLKSVKKEIEIVGNQIKLKSEATKSVETFFSQDKVKEGVTRKQYDETVKQVNAVKNKKVQEKLKLKLSEVDKELNRLDKVAKEKAEKEAKKTGGTVEKKEDGSYTVVPPKEGASSGSRVVAEVGGTQNYSSSEVVTNNTPATNNYSEAPKNNYSSPSSSTGTGGGQSSGGGSVVPSGGVSSNSNGNIEWDYVGKNGNNGGDIWVDPNDYSNIEDIPWIDFVNGSK